MGLLIGFCVPWGEISRTLKHARMRHRLPRTVWCALRFWDKDIRIMWVRNFCLARNAAGIYVWPAARDRLRKLSLKACSACLVLQFSSYTSLLATFCYISSGVKTENSHFCELHYVTTDVLQHFSGSKDRNSHFCEFLYITPDKCIRLVGIKEQSV